MAQATETLYVLLSAPGDVTAEDLATVHQTIRRWNFREGLHQRVTFVPIHWRENAIAPFGVRAQGSLNDQLVAVADALIALFRDRLGSDTGKAVSGTVEEIETVLEAKKFASLLRSTAPRRREVGTKYAEDALELEEWLADKWREHNMVMEYETPTELTAQIDSILSHLARQRIDLITALPEEVRTSAGVWPRIEVQERLLPGGQGVFTNARQYLLIVENRTNQLVENVQFEFVDNAGRPSSSFDNSFGETKAKELAPHGDLRYSFSYDPFEHSQQIRCRVTWEDAQGRHENTTTVRVY